MELIELTSQKTETFSAPGRRPSGTDELTRVSRSMSPRMRRVLDWLAIGGVFSADRLDTPPRKLRLYQHKRLIERLPKLQYGDREKELLGKPVVYCLGVLGEQIARQRFPFAPLTGYLLYTPSRILHDLILNETVFRLAEAARQTGWRTFWAGTNVAEIRNGSEQLIEPDALLILEKDEERKAFTIEYHNEEDKRQRAFDKVRRYERAREKSALWMSAWQVETFPPVLAVFRDNAVGLGYRDAVRELNAKGTYYGKSLEGIAKGNLQEWLNVRTETRERLF